MPPVTDAARAGGWRAAAARYAQAGAAAAVMLVLGLWGLARDSAMGNDEVATRWAALLSLRELAHLVNNVDAVHGLYYLLMHGWVAVGSSPEALRVPSVAAMTGAAIVIAVLARRLAGSGWAALFAGLVMVLTPDISYYAQTARSYAMVYVCVAGATLVLVHALAAEAAGAPGPRLARWWIGYGALVTLGGYLNEMSLLMLAAHAVTVLLARQGRRSVRHWAAAGGVGAVLVTPLILISIREHAAVNWIPGPASMTCGSSSTTTSARRPPPGCCCSHAPSWPSCPRGPPGGGCAARPAAPGRAARWPRAVSPRAAALGRAAKLPRAAVSPPAATLRRAAAPTWLVRAARRAVSWPGGAAAASAWRRWVRRCWCCPRCS